MAGTWINPPPPTIASTNPAKHASSTRRASEKPPRPLIPGRRELSIHAFLVREAHMNAASLFTRVLFVLCAMLLGVMPVRAETIALFGSDNLPPKSWQD